MFNKSLSSAILTCCLVFSSAPSIAYESDVHYGLTAWLALKAGFAVQEAEAIAHGDQRVDSGGPRAIDVVLDYGCALPDPAAAQRVQQAHFPSATSVPTLPSQRQVVAGSEAAQDQIHMVLREAEGKESLMLSRFGAALHVYQDSWSHAGVPSVIDFGSALKCEPELALSHPATRGGWASHNADLTFVYPSDALEMVKASYHALTTFPRIDGRARVAEPWAKLENEVQTFVRARTKTEKRAWFVARGISDTDFLGGITLPDGSEKGFVRSNQDLLPELKSNTSNQYGAAEDVRKFFDGFLTSWLSGSDADQSISGFLWSGSARKTTQLRARLKLLKMRDHGSVSALVHKQGALSASELRTIDALTRDAASLVRPASVSNALLPLVTKGVDASPVLPYITRELPIRANALPRAIAVLRLKHAPYDSVGLIAERAASGWKLLDVLVAVDH